MSNILGPGGSYGDGSIWLIFAKWVCLLANLFGFLGNELKMRNEILVFFPPTLFLIFLYFAPIWCTG